MCLEGESVSYSRSHKQQWSQPSLGFLIQLTVTQTEAVHSRSYVPAHFPGYPLQRSAWQWYICTGLSANGINHLGVFFSHSLCLLEVKLSLKLSFGLTDIGECLQGDLFCISRFGECPMCPLTTVQTSSEDWIPSLWCGCWEFIMFPRICFFICRFLTIQKLSELLQVELLARNSPFLSFSL